MYLVILLVFILGYCFIALEHTIKVDKAAMALLTGTLCWILFIIGRDTLLTEVDPLESIAFIADSLLDHVAEISENLFFYPGL